MQNIVENRQQWLDAYYRGDHQTLVKLETSDFIIIHNHKKDNIQQRYQNIAHLSKHNKWLPERLNEREVNINKMSDIEYQVTGIAFSSSLNIEFKEKWTFDQQTWRIAALFMVSH